jgi:hypothetical protein
VSAGYGAQLRTGESIAPQDFREKWIPGLRLAAHPGMTKSK